MKSICPYEIEDYLFETVDFKDFPNAGIFSTNTLYMPVTRIRTWVIATTTQCTNHYTITAVGLHSTVCILIQH